MARLSDSVRAAGKDDFFGFGADNSRQLGAGGINSFFGRPAKGVVTAGGIAKVLLKVGQHRL